MTFFVQIISQQFMGLQSLANLSSQIKLARRITHAFLSYKNVKLVSSIYVINGNYYKRNWLFDEPLIRVSEHFLSLMHAKFSSSLDIRSCCNVIMCLNTNTDVVTVEC